MVVEGDRAGMSEVLNVLTSKNAYGLTTNRDSNTKKVKVYYIYMNQIVIEAWENHKFIFWLSKTDINDTSLNAEIFDLLLTNGYDYVGYSYKIAPELHVGNLLDYYSVEYPLDKSMDGASFAKAVIERKNELVEKCQIFENTPAKMRMLEGMKQRVEAMGGQQDEAAYRALSEDIKNIWELEYLKMSPNFKIKQEYKSLYASLSSVYNNHMNSVR